MRLSAKDKVYLCFYRGVLEDEQWEWYKTHNTRCCHNGKFDPKTMEATVIWCWGPREHREDVIVTTPTTDLPSLKKPDIIEPSGHIPQYLVPDVSEADYNTKPQRRTEIDYFDIKY